jgi:hypothetical protein
MAEDEDHILRDIVIGTIAGGVVGGVLAGAADGLIAAPIGASAGCGVGIYTGWLGPIVLGEIREWPARRREEREFKAAREREALLAGITVFDVKIDKPQR